MHGAYGRLLDLTGDGIGSFTWAEGRVLTANPALVAILGLRCDPGELVGRGLRNLVRISGPQDAAQTALVQKGELRGHELHFLTQDGADRWVICDLLLTTDPTTNEQVVEALVRDVTSHRQTEQALRDSDQLLRATLESTADGLLVVGDQGQVLHANARFAELWRIPAELLATRDDQRLLDYVLDQLQDPQAFLAKVQELYGTAREDFDTLFFKDGRVLERSSRPLIRDGKVTGRVWGFSDITQRHQAQARGRQLVERLRKLLPKQLIEIRIQASIGNKIIASERIAPLRKDVTAKCYGGDITRKRKLLEKQKAGKRRMKQIGKVQVPQEAFMQVLRLRGDRE